jgi:hypothetical protein
LITPSNFLLIDGSQENTNKSSLAYIQKTHSEITSFNSVPSKWENLHKESKYKEKRL